MATAKRLKVETIYKTLYDLFTLFMSGRNAKGVLAHFCGIERERGYRGLAEEIQFHVRKILDLHQNEGRSQLIELSREKGDKKHKPFRRFRGPLRIFYLISLRSGKRGGLEKAMQLLDFRGHIFYGPTDNRDVARKASSLREVVDPFARFDLKTGGEVITAKGTEYLEGKEAIDMPPQLVEIISRYWGDDLFRDRFPYPYDHKKMMVKTNLRIPNYKVIPSDIIKSLDLCPNLVHANYEYVQHVFGSMVPPKSHFEGAIASNDVGGGISPLDKDAKNKVREVFPTYFAIMQMTAPLHFRLKRILKDLSCCFCFDQDGGVKWAVEKLSAGTPLSSIDLHKASDHIPLFMQMREAKLVLGEVEYAHNVLDVFYRACRAKWVSPWNSRTYVRLLKGTPMGLPGSYYLFTLHLIWRLLENGVPLQAFAIVGDDLIVVSYYDSTVRWILEYEEVPVSVNKSIYRSTSLAEFCGRLITKEGPLSYGKSKAFNEDDPLTSVRKYGESAFHLMPSLSSRDIALLKLALKKGYDAEWWDAFVQDEQPSVPAIGGPTPYQYYRLGMLTRKQFVTLVTLIGLSYTPNRSPFSELLEGKIFYSVKDRKTKRRISKNYALKDGLLPKVKKLLDAPARTSVNAEMRKHLRVAPRREEIRHVDDLIKESLYALNAEAFSRSGGIFPNSVCNPKCASRIRRKHYSDVINGVADCQEEMDQEQQLALLRSFYGDDTEDTTKPTAVAQMSVTDDYSQSFAMDPDLLEPKQLASDLRDGFNVAMVEEEKQPLWKAIISVPFSPLVYIYQALFIRT